MNSIHSSNYRTLAIVLLIMTTILWGTTFIITKIVTKEVPIFLFLSLRYLIALIGFAPLLIRFIKKINKKILIYGTISGIIYYFAVVTQTYGLQTTSASKVGFITGLNAVMVPFIVWLFFRKSIDKRIWIAAGLSVIGMALLVLEGLNGVLIGDLLVLGCAVFCALFIVYNEKYVKLIDISTYSIVQLIVLTVLCFTSSLILQESYDLSKVEIGIIDFWLIMLYMGLIATTVTFLFQNYGQRHQTASQAAIIFALEPVFAAFFAYLIGNEILSWQAWIGCSIIFIAIIITVIKNDNFNKYVKEKDKSY